jgi:hypothetical protein
MMTDPLQDKRRVVAEACVMTCLYAFYVLCACVSLPDCVSLCISGIFTLSM